MPDYIINQIQFKANENTLAEIKKLISTDDKEISFNNILPVPDLKDYDEDFSFYHVLYRLANLGILEEIPKRLPKVSISEYKFVSSEVEYLEIVKQLDSKMKELVKTYGYNKDDILNSIIKKLRSIYCEYILYYEFDYFLEEYINKDTFKSIVEKNSKEYLSNLLEYGVLDSLAWKIFYWGTPEDAIESKWINDNTIEFLTSMSVLNLVYTIIKRFKDVEVEYSFSDLCKPIDVRLFVSTKDRELEKACITDIEKDNIIKKLFDVDTKGLNELKKEFRF